jgi:dihydropteroate synthase
MTFAGLALDKLLIMGIVNVTPDSFSDGGETQEAEYAIARGLAFRDQGADILDVGGESTRPGAEPVSLEEELNRVIPVVRELADAGAIVSIDTRHAQVMTAKSGAAVILMHMRDEPGTMQDDPVYEDAALEVRDYLSDRVRVCESAGILRDQIAVDPGIGFGKTVAHNLEILGRLDIYQDLPVPVVLGVSRKSFIGHVSQGEPPMDRVAGSLAAALAGVAQGVHIIRVHDVAETCQALAVHAAIANATR